MPKTVIRISPLYTPRNIFPRLKNITVPIIVNMKSLKKPKVIVVIKFILTSLFINTKTILNIRARVN